MSAPQLRPSRRPVKNFVGEIGVERPPRAAFRRSVGKIDWAPASSVLRAAHQVTQAKKEVLLGALRTKLEDELENMRRAAKDAREAATHEEAKPENDKDTRALEASYLAGAQAARVRELEGSLKAIGSMVCLDCAGKAVQASAVVTLEDDDGVRATFFVAPFGGGTQLQADDLSVQVVTPQSPLGRALLGRSEGDVIEVQSRTITGAKAQLREMTIVDVW